MRYNVCEYCGAALDCGERCDCIESSLRRKKKHFARGTNSAKCTIKKPQNIEFWCLNYNRYLIECQEKGRMKWTILI